MTALATLDVDDRMGRMTKDAHKMFLAFQKQQLELHLFEFVKQAWHLVEPDHKFEGNWHLEELCRVLQDIYHGKIKRAIINVPPGTMKSLLVEVFFPAWVWAKSAKKRFLTASYGQHLTTRDNLRTRQIIESPWYQERWPVKLMDDQNTKTRYNTTEHGFRIASSVNGQGIGEHPDFIIIDDPHTDAQAHSETERQSALDWFDRTISTRLGRNPAIIVVMQRLHQGDLSGHLLERGGWVHVRWPMRYEKCTCPPDADEVRRCVLHKADPTWVPDPRDPRTQPGELLFPTLFPEEKVKQLELDLGPYGAAGQLQQRPSPEGGGQFKREWFADKIRDAAPALMRMVRSWDTAGTEDDGDYTCGCKVGEEFTDQVIDGKRIVKSAGRFWILDMQRDQLSPEGVDSLITATAQLDGRAVSVYEEQEPGSSGKTVVRARAKSLKGYKYEFAPATGSKVTKAKPFRSQCQAGNVFLLRGSWNEPFIRELCDFPAGKHDDQVDAAANGFNQVLLAEPPRKVKLTWGD